MMLFNLLFVANSLIAFVFIVGEQYEQAQTLLLIGISLPVYKIYTQNRKGK